MYLHALKKMSFVNNPFFVKQGQRLNHPGYLKVVSILNANIYLPGVKIHSKNSESIFGVRYNCSIN